MNLSRDRLAEKAELSARFLACVENSSGGLSVTSLRALSVALNVSCDYLVMGCEYEGFQGELIELLKRIDPADMELALRPLTLFVETAEQIRRENHSPNRDLE